MAATTAPKTITSTITIKLRNRLVKIHASRRHRKAISYMREHIARHFKSDPESIKISQKLNEYMEANSTNRLKPVTISISRTGGLVEAALPGERKVEKAPEKKKAEQEAKPASTAPAVAASTTKAVAEVQKEVAKEIGKKAEQKKEPKTQEKKTEKPAAAPSKSETNKPADPAKA